VRRKATGSLKILHDRFSKNLSLFEEYKVACLPACRALPATPACLPALIHRAVSVQPRG
jgi:hypothetical protein